MFLQSITVALEAEHADVARHAVDHRGSDGEVPKEVPPRRRAGAPPPTELISPIMIAFTNPGSGPTISW